MSLNRTVVSFRNCIWCFSVKYHSKPNVLGVRLRTFSQNSFGRVTKLSEVAKDIDSHLYYILNKLVTALDFCFHHEMSEQVKLSKKLQLVLEPSFCVNTVDDELHVPCGFIEISGLLPLLPYYKFFCHLIHSFVFSFLCLSLYPAPFPLSFSPYCSLTFPPSRKSCAYLSDLKPGMRFRDPTDTKLGWHADGVSGLGDRSLQEQMIHQTPKILQSQGRIWQKMEKIKLKKKR